CSGSGTLQMTKAAIRSGIGNPEQFIKPDNREGEAALEKLGSIEPEPWAAAWSANGEKWEQKARDEERTGNAAAAKDAFIKAYGYYGIARDPFPNSPGKQRAYDKTREMYLAASKYFDIQLEVVSMPMDGKTVIGNLRLPKKLPAPMIMHWGGIDNWKEERLTFAEALVREGWGCLVIDSPGTGECPMLAGPDAHRVHSAALDYLVKRPEVDANKIAVVGASFGGYWATKMAHI